MNEAPPLLNFVLENLRVEIGGNVGSRQHCNDGSFACQRRILPHTNLIYVARGRVVWFIDHVEYRLGPGSLLLSPPDVPHEAKSRTQRITLLSMHIQANLPGGQDAIELLGLPTVREVPSFSRLDGYLQAALREHLRDDLNTTLQMLRAHADLVVQELLRADAAANRLTPRPADPLVADMLGDLERRIAKRTTLKDLATAAGYSPQHLNRLFRQTLGVTPMQQLTHLRMQHAADLLRNTEHTLSYIAQQVAVDSPYYFSRLFKRHIGVSPDHFRNASDSNRASS